MGFSIIRKVFVIIIIAVSYLTTNGQDTGVLEEPDDASILYRKEASFYGLIHNEGWGFGARKGTAINGFKKRFFELELVTVHHPKEVKISNPYYTGFKSYAYGKLNDVVIPRFGIGLQKVITDKPYWGGVELRYFYYGGVDIAVAKPVYLYVLEYNTFPWDPVWVLDRYDPSIHVTDNILGKGPLLKGFDQLKLYPGAYAKFGMNFEYGVYDENTRTIESGVVLDFFPYPLPLMANNDPNFFIVSAYISFSIGKRYN